MLTDFNGESVMSRTIVFRCYGQFSPRARSRLMSNRKMKNPEHHENAFHIITVLNKNRSASYRSLEGLKRVLNHFWGKETATQNNGS